MKMLFWLRAWLRAFLAEHGAGLAQNDLKLASLKNIHEGERCFLIGNGPSLNPDDLDRLKGEITFAANKIYLMFSQTSWRPSYYFVVDSLVARNNSNEIKGLDLKKFFVRGFESLFGDGDDIFYLPAANYCGTRSIISGIDHGATVIAAMIQVADYMGFDEMYLIGLDFSFDASVDTGHMTEHGDRVLVQKDEINHFHPEYRKPGELWTYPKLDEQRRFFSRIRSVLKKRRHKEVIFNASRSTKLDVFPRIDLDELLRNL